MDWVTDGEDAYDYTVAAHYDVVILDWMMPDAKGSACAAVCAKKVTRGPLCC